MISVIIPTLNNQDCISHTIAYLKRNSYTRLVREIIVIDLGSKDKTVKEAEKAGAKVYRGLRKSRVAQLNTVAQRASGELLLFLNPMLLPPPDFAREIVRMYNRKTGLGVFRTRSQNYPNRLLQLLSNHFVRFARIEAQGLIVVKELFIKGGQFNENARWPEYELIQRLRRYSKTEVLPLHIVPVFHQLSPSSQIQRTTIAFLIGCGVPEQWISQVEERIRKTIVCCSHPFHSLTKMLPHIRLHQSRVR